jgi:DNA sulfur modification protein DndD
MPKSEAQNSIGALSGTIDELKEEKNQKEKESEEIQRKLIRSGDFMTLEELNELHNDKVKLEESKIYYKKN